MCRKKCTSDEKSLLSGQGVSGACGGILREMLPDFQRNEIEKRLFAFEADEKEGEVWDVVKRRIEYPT